MTRLLEAARSVGDLPDAVPAALLEVEGLGGEARRGRAGASTATRGVTR
jgi:hypothetical protein